VRVERHETEEARREDDPEGNTWYFGTYQPFTFDHEAEQAKTASTG
jgi:hypothetical protein